MLTILGNTFLENPIGQTIGIIAFFISIYNFLFCKDKKFIIVTAIASLVWGIHFMSVGTITSAAAISAGAVNFFDVVKNFAALKWEKNLKWMWGFIISYIFIGIITFENFYSLLPVFCALLTTYLVFFVRGVKLKIGFLIVVLIWFIFNIYIQSIGGMLTDAFILCSCVAGILKDIREEKNNIK